MKLQMVEYRSHVLSPGRYNLSLKWLNKSRGCLPPFRLQLMWESSLSQFLRQMCSEIPAVFCETPKRCVCSKEKKTIRLYQTSLQVIYDNDRNITHYILLDAYLHSYLCLAGHTVSAVILHCSLKRKQHVSLIQTTLLIAVSPCSFFIVQFTMFPETNIIRTVFPFHSVLATSLCIPLVPIYHFKGN